MLLAIARNDPVPPRDLNPDVPAGLNDLILRLLAKDPAARPQSARAVVEAIRALEQSRAAAALSSAIPSITIDTGEDASDSLVLRPAATARAGARRPAVVVDRGRGRRAVADRRGAGGPRTGCRGSAKQLYNEGTLVLQSPSPAVAVAVKREGRLVGVLEPGAGPVLRLEAGTYELVLSDTAAAAQARQRADHPGAGRTEAGAGGAGAGAAVGRRLAAATGIDRALAVAARRRRRSARSDPPSRGSWPAWGAGRSRPAGRGSRSSRSPGVPTAA